MAAPTPQQLMQWLKPEPPSSQELEWMEKIKPGEYEICSEKLTNITMEAAEVLLRTGISAMLRGGDNIVAIYTPEGDLVTTSCGTFIHAVSAQLPIKYVGKHWKDDPTVGVREGDIFYNNEALYGGLHNPDQGAIMPVFYKGELIAWTSALVHQPETGGIDPGGMCPSAKSRYDEGMRLSPMKIGENYRIRNDILEMMQNFVSRAPRMQVTDVRARVSACDRARIRIQELAEEKGKEFILGLFRKILITCEEATRQRIKTWNDGKYRVAIFSDNVHPTYLGMNRAFFTMQKEDDHITFDLSGTSPENYSAWQAFAHAVAAHSAIHIYSYICHDLPVCCGTLAPFDWVVPEGTWLNPSFNAACSIAPPACNVVMVATPQLLSKLIFDSEHRDLVAAATGSSSGAAVVYFGTNQYGVTFTDILVWNFNTCGQGARSDMDGMNACIFSWCNTGFSPDVEDSENEIPVLWLFAKHWKDGCGFGKYQGGTGGECAATLHHVPIIICTAVGTGSKLYVGQGIFGGYPAPPMPICRIYGTNLMQMMAKGDRKIPSDMAELVTKRAITGQYEFSNGMIAPYMKSPGDVIVYGMGGGCGYGDALERDPELVMKSVRNELISHSTADRIYRVVYDPETLEVDYKLTEKLRKKERQKRLKRGKPYEEFETEWQQKWPNTEIMEYYGSWPDAEPITEIMRI